MGAADIWGMDTILTPDAAADFAWTPEAIATIAVLADRWTSPCGGVVIEKGGHHWSDRNDIRWRIGFRTHFGPDRKEAWYYHDGLTVEDAVDDAVHHITNQISLDPFGVPVN